MALICAPLSLRAQGRDSSGNSPDASGSLDSGVAQGALPDLGTGNFSRSPFHVSVAVREGYDDNVYTTSQNPVGSFFTNGSVVVDYKFGNARTMLDLQVNGGATYYYSRSSGRSYDLNSGLVLSASHQATPRLGFAASAYFTYQSEPDFNAAFGLNRRSGDYFYTEDKFSVSYQWAPRFSTVTSYTLGAVNYQDSAIGAYENRFEHTFGNEFRFLLLPTTTLVGEYRYGLIDFETAPNNSTTHFVLVGVDHSFSPHFNVSMRGGVEFREFDNFGSETAPYGEATLKYSLGPRTSLSWTNRYGLDEPDVPGTPSRTTFRTGLNVAYAFTPRFTSTLAVFYEHDQNNAVSTPLVVVPGFAEDSIDFALGLRYEINRTFALLAGYSHTEVFSDISLRDYARNRIYLGLDVDF